MWDVISKRFPEKRRREKSWNICALQSNEINYKKKCRVNFFRIIILVFGWHISSGYFIMRADWNAYCNISLMTTHMWTGFNSQILIKHAIVVVSGWMNFNDAHSKTEFFGQNDKKILSGYEKFAMRKSESIWKLQFSMSFLFCSCILLFLHCHSNKKNILQ